MTFGCPLCEQNTQAHTLHGTPPRQAPIVAGAQLELPLHGGDTSDTGADGEGSTS